MEDISGEILPILPSIFPEDYARLLLLLSRIGVETSDDLTYVKEEDLLPVLKVIQARKLLAHWQRKKPTLVASVSNQNTPVIISIRSEASASGPSLTTPSLPLTSSSAKFARSKTLTSSSSLAPMSLPSTLSALSSGLVGSDSEVSTSVPSLAIPSSPSSLSPSPSSSVRARPQVFIPAPHLSSPLLPEPPSVPVSVSSRSSLLTSSEPLSTSTKSEASSPSSSLTSPSLPSTPPLTPTAASFPLGWEDEFCINYDRMPVNLRRDLSTYKQLQPAQRRAFVRFIVDEMFLYSERPSRSQCAAIARKIVKKHPYAFTESGEADDSTHLSLFYQMKCRVENTRRQKPQTSIRKPHKSKASAASNVASLTMTSSNSCVTQKPFNPDTKSDQNLEELKQSLTIQFS